LAPVDVLVPLDGSYSEGDGMSYAWTVTPSDGATLIDADSPFAALIFGEPGQYTLTLTVCDEVARCDTASTWARADVRPDASRSALSAPDRFSGAMTGAGALDGVKDDDDLCDECRAAAKGTSSQWAKFCSSLPNGSKEEKQVRGACQTKGSQSSTNRTNWCGGVFCD
jgi:hypothetical protein